MEVSVNYRAQVLVETLSLLTAPATRPSFCRVFPHSLTERTFSVFSEFGVSTNS